MGKTNLKNNILEEFTVLDSLHCSPKVDAPPFPHLFMPWDAELHGTNQPDFLVIWLLQTLSMRSTDRQTYLFSTEGQSALFTALANK